MRGLRQLRNTDGSSMVSVLVAFIILLLGIAGFARAVTTANNMVRRAEMLNAATGEVLEKFYPDYANQPEASGIILSVYEKDSGAPAFTLHGRLRKRNYSVTITAPGEEESAEPETVKYDMYFYK